MCTAVTYLAGDHYFGRNLDLECTYNEKVTVTPRNFAFPRGILQAQKNHYAMIGMAAVVDGYPLYYDATNEKGLSMAGLHFPDNAVYHGHAEMKVNVAPFEFIPWVLGQCETVSQVRDLLENTNLARIDFSRELPCSPLHWMIADKWESITVESVAEGLRVYDNLVGVLTNNPPFPMQMFNLHNYMHLSTKAPENRFSDRLELSPYSRGMGAMGMPGDLSSASRFVRAVFTKLNSVSEQSESSAVSQFFHILYAVYQQRGCVDMGDGLFEITNYSSCCNTDRGIYYYTTYENSRITGIDMHKESLDGDSLATFPLVQEQQIYIQN